MLSPACVVVIPLGSALLPTSSSLPGSANEAGHLILPYLALLRAGFTLPVQLLGPRCALTAPFHPYHGSKKPWRYLFCGTCRSLRLEAQPPVVNRRVALWRPDFPPSGASPLSDYLSAEPRLKDTIRLSACKFWLMPNDFKAIIFFCLR